MPDLATPSPDALLAHAAFVRALARRLVGDEEADDVAQETWRRALAHPPRRPGALRPWLATVARNVARRGWRGDERRRRREREAARPAALPAAEVSAAELAERETLLRAVVDAVLALPEPQRVAVLLRYYEDLPPRAIAERLGVPAETVHSRLARARRELRRRLDSTCGGSPRAWCGALLSLAGGDPSAGTKAALAGGALAMKTHVAAGIASVVLLAAGLGAWRLASESGASGIEARAGGGIEASDALRPGSASGERMPAVPAADAPLVLSGRATDPAGAGVAGVGIWVLAEEDPFGQGPETAAVNELLGRSIPTGEDGRYSVAVPGASRVFVAVESSPRYRVAPGSDRGEWVDLPAGDVDFVVHPTPTATLTVRASDLASKVELESFLVAVQSEGIGYSQKRAEGGAATFVLRVEDPAGVDAEVWLLSPEPPEPAARTVHLAPGEERELVLVVPTEGMTSGWVVDHEGDPVAGAVVWFGDQIDGRGDEPFRPFRSERVSGVETAADGWYELSGSGKQVSVWHADHTAATVPVEDSSRIELAPRAAIRGRAVGADGRPAAGRILVLDDRSRGTETTTDGTGAFAFERLEAGAHGIWVKDGGFALAVRLEPGETTDVELALDARGALELDLVDGDAPYAGEGLDGLLVGLDRVFGVYELEAPARTVDAPVHPGRYLLVTRSGRTALFTVDGPRATVPLGAVPLTVRAEPGRRLQVAPADADHLTRVLAARLQVAVPESGEAVFHVEPGEWILVANRAVVLATVEVPAEGTTVELAP